MVTVDSHMFEKTVRVYYEDTDAGGIVYHSNYLNFMERCRCDWLMHMGFSVADLETHERLSFVVREANVTFQHPARLFDELRVTVQVLQVGKVKLQLRQAVYNGQQELCSAIIKLAVLNSESFKLTSMPDDLRQKLLTTGSS